MNDDAIFTLDVRLEVQRKKRVIQTFPIERLCLFGQCAFTQSPARATFTLNAVECVRRVLFCHLPVVFAGITPGSDSSSATYRPVRISGADSMSLSNSILIASFMDQLFPFDRIYPGFSLMDHALHRS
ncbi:hypothetical protein [Paraburkholderia hospita]|uniref:hypothetical protein n=1 Tax=Paraburkholderia hospita TaxID=169430 RepID=UPI0011780A33|nr:hypothetical protein [Paraburkholderia hospita]